MPFISKQKGNELHKFCMGKAGDIVAAQDVGDAEGLQAGPPCTPWAGNGRRRGCHDPLAEVFERVIDEVCALATKGSLLFFGIENTPNIKHMEAGESMPWLDKMLLKLHKSLPLADWVIDVRECNLVEWIPHSRRRLWIRGAKRIILGPEAVIPGIPIDPLGGFKISLWDLLDKNIPNMQPSDLKTFNRHRNLLDYCRLIQDAYRHRSYQHPCGDIAVFEIDRCLGKKFAGQIFYDCVPPLRVRGPDFFVASVLDVVHERPVSQRVFHRLLTNPERFLLQGQPAMFSSKFSLTLGRKATGNAIGSPMAASMMGPLVAAAMKYKRLRFEELEQDFPEGPAKRIKLC